ncbi:ADP-ribosyltransferase [Streptosporangium sp. CA-135522]|uniref:ADP-ribosyltransferase n=1 Tax=Streptosporangium sp. CA-135522 TaxID=3240072 RepID=UPI003D8FCDDB
MDLKTLLGPAFPYVEPVLGWVVGMDYPEGDAEKCLTGVEVLRATAGQIRIAGGEGDQALNHVLRFAQGPAANAMTAYWRTFTADEPAYVEELARACEKAADQLEKYGLDIDYTQKYIALVLILLAFTLLRAYAFGPVTGGASFWSIGPACTLARMNVRTIAALLLRSIAFMVGVDGATQVWQMAEGDRDSWDADKTLVAAEGGMLTALALMGLGGAITRLGGVRLLDGVVLKGEMTAREQVAAFLSQTVGGVAVQGTVASLLGSIPTLAATGQLNAEALAKAAASGFIGGIDGRAGHTGPRAADGLRLPTLPDPAGLHSDLATAHVGSKLAAHDSSGPGPVSEAGTRLANGDRPDGLPLPSQEGAGFAGEGGRIAAEPDGLVAGEPGTPHPSAPATELSGQGDGRIPSFVPMDPPFGDRLVTPSFGSAIWDDVVRNLPAEEYEAVYRYILSDYKNINGYLRDSEFFEKRLARGASEERISRERAEFPTKIELINRATRHLPLPEAIDVFRTLTMNDDLFTVPVDDLPGTVQRERGFMSTRIGNEAHWAYWKDLNVHLHLRVPEGTPAIYIESMTNGGEYELLLASDRSWFVEDVERVDGILHVYGRVLPDE